MMLTVIPDIPRLSDIDRCWVQEAAIPGGVEGFALWGVDVDELGGILPGEFADDGIFAFGGVAVDDHDLQFAGGEKGLGDEVFEAAADEAFALVGRNDGRDPEGACEGRGVGKSERKLTLCRFGLLPCIKNRVWHRAISDSRNRVSSRPPVVFAGAANP